MGQWTRGNHCRRPADENGNKEKQQIKATLALNRRRVLPLVILKEASSQAD